MRVGEADRRNACTRGWTDLGFHIQLQTQHTERQVPRWAFVHGLQRFNSDKPATLDARPECCWRDL